MSFIHHPGSTTALPSGAFSGYVTVSSRVETPVPLSLPF